MSVYYSKNRDAWFIRVSYKGRLSYCYSSPSGPFLRKRDALAYEPSFVLLLGQKSGLSDVSDSSSFSDAFLKDLSLGVKASTFYGERLDFLAHIKPLFEGVPLSSVDRFFLLKVGSSLESLGLSSGTHVYGICRKWLSFLNGIRASVPLYLPVHKRQSSLSRRSYSFYTLDEFRLFLSCIKDKGDELLFSILFYYGLRIGEALALRWCDFRDDGLHVERSMCFRNVKGEQYASTPKTSSSIRVLPRVDAVWSLLSDRHGSGYVFSSSMKGKCIGPSTVRRKIFVYSKEAGLKAIKIHEFRHSCATWLISSGVPVRNVSRWLGHSSESITLKVYSHLLPSEKDVVSDFINGKTLQNCGKSVVRKIKKPR